ncbi:MAG: ferrous iron transport protein B [Thermoproteota archaeon]
MSATETLGDDPEVVLADERYRVISNILATTLERKGRKWTLTDMLDQVFLHKILGIPVFLAVVWAMFRFTFDVSAPFMAIMEAFFGWLGEFAMYIPQEQIASFIGDGVLGGLGFIMVFIPPIFFMFLVISILEDSGYLARAAFVMDRLMYKLGLHGKSFIPMLLGLGCNIPAIMATRSIQGRKDRLITILVNPLISCSARLPVYVLVAGAFFDAYAGSAIFSMYILGIALAILMALLFRKTILKGEASPFIMELPLYKMPTLHGSLIHMWERGVVFLKKAGTYLLAGAIIMWFLSTYPWGAPVEASYAGQIGQLLEPLVRPLGFDWRVATSLLFGFLAKEIVVGSLGILYAVEGETAIGSALAASLTPASAYALMAFTLIYVPCLATIGVIKKETGSWRWVGLTVLYEMVLAYTVALLIVRIGGILG